MEVLDIARKLSELRAGVVVRDIDGGAESAADFRAMIDALESLLTEVKLETPNPSALENLYTDVQRHWLKVVNRATSEWSAGKAASSLGSVQDLELSRTVIEALSAKIVEIANRKTAALRAAISSVPPTPKLPAIQAPVGFSVQERMPSYIIPLGAPPTPEVPGMDVTKIITSATQRLGKAIEAHPESKADYVPVLEQLAQLSLHLITSRLGDAGAPPRGPVDTSLKHVDDGGMESRIANLEKFAEESRKDLRSIDVRLSKVETLVDGISKNMASKADIADVKAGTSQMETTILKWFIGTAITLTSLAFAAAKFLA